jgi:DNA-binding CsgD family transcriptional regulator
MSYFAFSIGKFTTAGLLGLMPEYLYVVCSIVALLLLLVSNVIVVLAGGRTGPHPSSSQDLAHDGLDRETDSLVSDSSNEARTRGNKLQHSCTALAEKYALTAREKEILVLLARGRTAQHIASSLTISPTTAKTHLRSIYAKLDVHTQQELLTLVEETIDQQRDSSLAPPH